MNVEMPVRRDMHRRDRQHDIFHVEENNTKKPQIFIYMELLPYNAFV